MTALLRSAFATVGALFVAVTLTLGADAIVRTMWQPSATTDTTYVTAQLVYLAAFSAIGGYIAGGIAGSRPVRHAVIFAIVATALACFVRIVAVAVVLPFAWAGGRWRQSQVEHREERTNPRAEA